MLGGDRGVGMEVGVVLVACDRAQIRGGGH